MSKGVEIHPSAVIDGGAVVADGEPAAAIAAYQELMA